VRVISRARQVADHVLRPDRARDLDSRSGAAPSPRGQGNCSAEVGAQRGQMEQDVVLANVVVLGPDRVGVLALV
jgi:hypothetical protein